MKNKYFILLFFLLPLLILSFNDNVFAKEATIDYDNVNVRSGPGVDFDKLKQVTESEVYDILKTEGDWIEIEFNDNSSGWIKQEFVSIKELSDDDSTGVESNVSSIKIVVDNTQIRAAGSIESDIIGFVDSGLEYPVLSESTDWYEIEFKNNKGYIFKELLTKKPSSAKNGLINKVIVIDAGHGGHDVGSIGVSGKYEKDLTLKTAMELKEELTLLGAEVILTREIDNYTRLSSRSSLSNLYSTDAFISVHYNSFPEESSVTGINSYYYHEKNKTLADFIQEGIIKETDANDRGIAHGDFLVLRANYKPSILLELDFISNPEREQLLLTNAYQKKLVKGIINGLTNYFNLK